ncbi:hypothetical protein BYT27DRAFT_7183001 [Phlegmacium glaucopus]|nr:hypothetical protein BYT27DRAFT_7183001 [Phlegmacium glaucopus]
MYHQIAVHQFTLQNYEYAPLHFFNNTLLDTFISIAQSEGVERNNVVECGDESWMYGDLDAISTGLTTLELHQKYGPKPVVTVISENHPNILATLFTTWKLSGVFAPLDYHRMLYNIAPTCVLVPSTEPVILNIVKGVFFPYFFYISC